MRSCKSSDNELVREVFYGSDIKHITYTAYTYTWLVMGDRQTLQTLPTYNLCVIQLASYIILLGAPRHSCMEQHVTF